MLRDRLVNMMLTLSRLIHDRTTSSLFQVETHLSLDRCSPMVARRSVPVHPLGRLDRVPESSGFTTPEEVVRHILSGCRGADNRIDVVEVAPARRRDPTWA